MARRIKYTAKVTVGHHNFTGFSPIGEITDARYVKVAVPELGWLDNVEISVENGKLRILVVLEEENRFGLRLDVDADGRFMLSGDSAS